MKELFDWLLRMAGYLAFAYLVFVIFIYFWQRRMLYYPDVTLPEEQQWQLLALTPWPANDANYRGWLGGEVIQPKGTVVVFHGNAGAAWHRAYYTEALGRLGYRVLLAEYPGYGGRKGSIGEASLVNDAAETVQMAQRQFGEPLYLWGESLGAGVAAAVVHRSDISITGTILLTPWDSLPSLANHYYPHLPTQWLMRDRYNSVENLASYTGKVAMVVAGSDEIIPNQFSLALYDTITAPKKLWRFEGAGHNSWPTAPDNKWWHEVMMFVSTD